jgi:hypothetical protein
MLQDITSIQPFGPPAPSGYGNSPGGEGRKEEEMKHVEIYLHERGGVGGLGGGWKTSCHDGVSLGFVRTVGGDERKC